MKYRFGFTIPLITLFMFLLSSCGSQTAKEEHYEPAFSVDSSKGKVLIFGVHSQSDYDIFNPLVEYLNHNLNSVKIKMVAAITSSDYEYKLNNGYFDFIIINGARALDIQNMGYTIFGKMGDDMNYRGMIVVHKDSLIRKITDLKGKYISFPDHKGLAGTLMPLYFLYKNGLDVNIDIKPLYVHSFESGFMNVYLGKTSACTSRPIAWELFKKNNPEIASKLIVKWQTPPLVNNALLVKNNLDHREADLLAELIFNLQNNSEGKKVLDQLSISKFENANTETYLPVQEFLQQFHSVIHNY